MEWEGNGEEILSDLRSIEDERRVLVFDPCCLFTFLFAWLYSVFIVHIFRLFSAYFPC